MALFVRCGWVRYMSLFRFYWTYQPRNEDFLPQSFTEYLLRRCLWKALISESLLVISNSSIVMDVII